jgi:hypothetical protein
MKMLRLPQKLLSLSQQLSLKTGTEFFEEYVAADNIVATDSPKNYCDDDHEDTEEEALEAEERIPTTIN